jgi:hypothetical protein
MVKLFKYFGKLDRISGKKERRKKKEKKKKFRNEVYWGGQDPNYV